MLRIQMTDDEGTQEPAFKTHGVPTFGETPWPGKPQNFQAAAYYSSYKSCLKALLDLVLFYLALGKTHVLSTATVDQGLFKHRGRQHPVVPNLAHVVVLYLQTTCKQRPP